MNLDESNLTRLRRQGTRANTARSGCLSAELLARAAGGELAAAERSVVADHLAACADCAEELRLLAPLAAFAERSAVALGRAPAAAQPSTARIWSLAMSAAAATLLVACGALLLWVVTLQRENRELASRVAIPVVTSVPRTAPAATIASNRAHVNVPIVDLQPDALRGADAGATIATVSAASDVITLILNTDRKESPGPYTLDVIDAQGKSSWRSESLVMTPFHTFTLALSPGAFMAGTYRLVLSHVSGGRRETLETYTLRIDPRAPAPGR